MPHVSPDLLDHPGTSDVTDVTGGFTDVDGLRCYRIGGFQHLPPFLVPVVGPHDVWLFLSSAGGLTAGRTRPDDALFPYATEDKLADTAGTTGGFTVIRAQGPDGREVRWEPLSPAGGADPRVSRSLSKDALSTTVVVEEVREDLGLRFREVWRTSGTFGVVRESRLAAVDGRPHAVRILDGVRNLLPPGVGVRVQGELSVLVDAYKRARVEADTGLATYWMGSELTDRAEPREALLATVCWRTGLPEAEVLLGDTQIHRFRRGGDARPEAETRGRRGAHLLHARIDLDGGEERRWRLVMDGALDAAAVVDLSARLRHPDALSRAVSDDLEAGYRHLLVLVGAADATQVSGEEITGTHHAANVLFNAMRGGVFPGGYTVRGADVRDFCTRRSPRPARRCAPDLAALPATLTASGLAARARATDDPDLARLLAEYLPLAWGRRHGDPSRPWNTFEIAPPSADGGPRPGFEGNWRDIFQNWEALAWSFPEYTEPMICAFLSATTVDGYNPYRISRDGVDWERPDPDEPWSNIGYWSDHQIVYLLALLRTAQRFHPGRLPSLLSRQIFTHADVPYRIRGYRQILADPRTTIDYDDARAETTRRRVQGSDGEGPADGEGADGRLLTDAHGELIRVTGTEKLLLLLLAKLVNLVPGAGIWMNTQRPEWNDANNALAGYGASVVTLAQLHSYLVTLPEVTGLPDGTRPTGERISLTEETADLLDQVGAALAEHERLPSAGGSDTGGSDTDRRRIMDLLGEAGTRYRERVYAGPGGRRTAVPAARVAEVLGLARRVVEAGLRANRRADGLYHSYNRLVLRDGTAGVERLPLMLEGQVAVLASGVLAADEELTLLRGLRRGPLFRADTGTYQLYPDRDLPGFVERNTIPGEAVRGCPLAGLLAKDGGRGVVVRDVEGGHHFAGGMRNADDVRRALAELAAAPEWESLVRREGERLLGIYEEVFRHAEFTGRSGSFFGYEGLGCVYWHMVAKLQLAVLASHRRAAASGAAPDVVRELAEVYREVRGGLGFTRTPEVFGAFPADPHSHTPAGGGARQPGMTGQVKEAILARFGELGLEVERGRIRFVPPLIGPAEGVGAAAELRFPDARGRWRTVPVPAGGLAFTFAQVPVRYRRGDGPSVVAVLADGSRRAFPDGVVDRATSASIFRREGTVDLLEVTLPW